MRSLLSAWVLLLFVFVGTRPGAASRDFAPTQPRVPAGHVPNRSIAQAQVGTAAQPSGYVGASTCAVCHSDVAEGLSRTHHGQSANPRSPAGQTGCESCHGPGQAHVEDDDKKHILRFSELSPGARNAVCLTCHNRGEHAGWEGSAHEARNLSCLTCHSVHSPVSFERQLNKSTEKEVCATCHRVQVAKTERGVAHMPVREGKMQCSSCHNPHGSINNVRQLRVGTSIAESCMSCHQEMRAPVIFEHAPVKENCATCHDPHGSSNDRMLTVRAPMLCQRCHVATRHPATVYDNAAITRNKSNRMFGRSCMNCHSTIHGSNHPSGQFFMR